MSQPTESRCPVWHRDGLQCQLHEGHKGEHEHAQQVVWRWHTDKHERERLEREKSEVTHP